MHVRPGMAAALVGALALLAPGCSNSKYSDQIEQQKLQISELQQRNYQMEMEASRQKAGNDALGARAAASESGPSSAGGGGAGLGGETAGVSFGGGDGGGGESVAEKIVLDSEVLFNSGQSSLSAKGLEALKSVAAKLKRNYSGRTIRVDGHTDNIPIKKTKDKFPTNWELSALRACSVARYLIEQGGLPAGNFYVAGFGDQRPRDSNSSSAGRAKNRRVEITILQ